MTIDLGQPITRAFRYEELPRFCGKSLDLGIDERVQVEEALRQEVHARPTTAAVEALIASARAAILGGVDSDHDTLRELRDANLANSAHTTATNNPHNVTKAQVGLGNANNTSDADKPISTATQAALNALRPARAFAAFAGATGVLEAGSFGVTSVTRHAQGVFEIVGTFPANCIVSVSAQAAGATGSQYAVSSTFARSLTSVWVWVACVTATTGALSGVEATAVFVVVHGG